jgi:hypothetical protein
MKPPIGSRGLRARAAPAWCLIVSVCNRPLSWAQGSSGATASGRSSAWVAAITTFIMAAPLWHIYEHSLLGVSFELMEVIAIARRADPRRKLRLSAGAGRDVYRKLKADQITSGAVLVPNAA